MPYRIQKVPGKNLYCVVDLSGKHYSKEGMSRYMAVKQKRALDIAHAKKMGYI